MAFKVTCAHGGQSSTTLKRDQILLTNHIFFDLGLETSLVEILAHIW